MSIMYNIRAAFTVLSVAMIWFLAVVIIAQNNRVMDVERKMAAVEAGVSTDGSGRSNDAVMAEISGLKTGVARLETEMGRINEISAASQDRMADIGALQRQIGDLRVDVEREFTVIGSKLSALGSIRDDDAAMAQISGLKTGVARLEAEMGRIGELSAASQNRTADIAVLEGQMSELQADVGNFQKALRGLQLSIMARTNKDSANGQNDS